LNQQLLTACQQDEHRLIAGREQMVGVGLLVERDFLLPLAAEGVELAQTSFPMTDGLGCIKVLTNAYSVPLPAGTQVQAKIYASTVELWRDGRCVASHERCYRPPVWNGLSGAVILCPNWPSQLTPKLTPANRVSPPLD
jgi:hypothetical protein